jgi:hypothetical protein
MALKLLKGYSMLAKKLVPAVCIHCYSQFAIGMTQNNI